MSSDDTSLPPELPPEENNDLPPSEPPVGSLLPPTDDPENDLPIEDELKDSYLTYAMSVIVSRALPDVRDGLKPSQRRILVAMNDLNLGPGAGRVKCAKISGDTSGNYHPHGESVIYPTLVRMAQEWNMRHVLIDKQGNFGSIAGLPPAAMRYTEARMSHMAGLMLDDIKLDTVDYIPTYDERNLEPTVLPSKFPNLLVNGAGGIAVGMSTSIPPHNLSEVCQCVISLIERPSISIDELMEICPGPDFPTGGEICGRANIRKGYHTGRSTLTIRARAEIEPGNKNRHRIVIKEIPYQQARDRIEELIAAAVQNGKITGISALRNESDLKEPVRLICDLKRDADPEIVLNQLYQFTPLQDSFSIIFLALVDGKPRTLSFKELLEEFIRHRVTVIRRRTLFLRAKARKRKHTVEGLLLAHANIDEVIRTIRTSATQAEAKQRLMQIETPSSLLQRALGDEGFAVYSEEYGEKESYTLTAVQSDAILRMTLGQLVNLEQEKLGKEFGELLEEIKEYNRILSDKAIILGMICDDMRELIKKHGEPRRTEISGQEIGSIDYEELITEETMVVSITQGGYVKRTAATEYKAQKRGGKGLRGAQAAEEDPVEHLFVASTHAYLCVFTNRGRMYWLKVYDLPQGSRNAKGRAIVNLLENLEPGETIESCRAIKDFTLEDHYLVMATKNGLFKKTALAAYGRPRKAGLIAINLREDDELVSVAIAGPGDELLLATASGKAIRFQHELTRPVGRNSMGVKGIRVAAGDEVVGMVVADPDADLLSVCLNGYGKRTPFGPNKASDTEGDSEEVNTNNSFRAQGRGGQGVVSIKTSARNGPVIGICSVTDEDELMMITAKGQIQRIRAADVSQVGRNTQGVRVMNLRDGDSLVAIKAVPRDETEDENGNGNGENAESSPEENPTNTNN